MPAEVSKNSKPKHVEGILVPVGGYCMMTRLHNRTSAGSRSKTY